MMEMIPVTGVSRLSRSRDKDASLGALEAVEEALDVERGASGRGLVEDVEVVAAAAHFAEFGRWEPEALSPPALDTIREEPHSFAHHAIQRRSHAACSESLAGN